MAWVPAHDDVLRAQIAAGKSFGDAAHEINRVFGTGYSRNATIGRAGRLRIASQSGRNGCETSAKTQQVKRDKAEQIAAHSNLPARYVRSSKPRMICDAPPLAGGNGPRDVALLDATGCRWPSGDGVAVPFTFCNAASAFKGCAYCAEHRRMALRNAA
jgi:GcrA cell cycle regulator